MSVKPQREANYLVVYKITRRQWAYLSTALFAALSLWRLLILIDYQQYALQTTRPNTTCPFDIRQPTYDRSLFIAHRQKLIDSLAGSIDGNHSISSVNQSLPFNVVVFGRRSSINNDGVDFKQDPNFYYLTGVNYPSSVLVIQDFGVYNGSRLHFSRLYLQYRDIAFEGAYPVEQIMVESGIDAVQILNSTESVNYDGIIIGNSSVLYTNNGAIIRDIPASVTLDEGKLKDTMFQLRRQKDPVELDLIRYATQVASYSHLHLMQLMAQRSAVKSEYSLLSQFKHDTFICGCRVQAYDPIVAANDHAAVLHYQGFDETAGNALLRSTASLFRRSYRYILDQNNRRPTSAGFLLVDASGSYRNYASDVTRTIPLGLEFSEVEKQIYEIVYQANTECITMLKAGVKWSDVAAHADNVLLRGLLRMNLIKFPSKQNSSFQQLIQYKVARAFMPHGLGHTVGLDVHDVQPSPNDLVLLENDVVTIEPGLYFNAEVLNRVKSGNFEKVEPQAKEYINWAVVDQFVNRKLGGVRIEDVVLITVDGHEVFSNDAPKALHDIERILKQ
ncbi:hypothetical protein MIR68_000182 [Amoeboaphelidium protococcarum]|nr:hypothetical protein MIR68_000182 [Amoeboaphelidium protococcarum]